MGLFDKPQQPQTQGPSTERPAGLPNSQTSNDPFDRIGGASVSEGGVYPLPGLYPLLFIDACKMIVSRKKEDLFIVEFDIVESQVAERPAGTRMSWAANLTKHDAAPGNVRGFIAKLFGVPVDEVKSTEARVICSAQNPAHGKLIRLEAANTTTKAGTLFTKCFWSTVPAEVQAQAKELRAKVFDLPF